MAAHLRSRRCIPLVAALLVWVAGCPPDQSGGDRDTSADVRDVGSTDGTDRTGDTDTAPDTARPVDVADADTAGDATDDGAETGDVSPEAGDGSETDGEPISIVELIRAARSLRAEGYCSALFDCSEKLQPTTTQYLAGLDDVQECRDHMFGPPYRDTPADLAEPIERDIERGLTTFDREQASACLDAMRERNRADACDRLGMLEETNPACREVFRGTQPVGAPCSRARHCQSRRCDESAKPDECYGACVPAAEPVGRGESCGDPGKRCKSGEDLDCVYSDADQKQICQKIQPAGSGEDCSSPLQCKDRLTCLSGTCTSLTIRSQGESCGAEEQRCELGLLCRSSGSGEGMSTSCQPPGGVGDSCTNALGCSYELYCDGPQEENAGTCQKRNMLDESCDADEDCWSDNCQDGTCSESDRQTACTVPVED